MTDDANAIANSTTDLVQLAARINEAHRQAEAHAVSAVEHAAEAGRLLVAAKAGCAHGTWLPWLEANVACSVRTAQAYMRVARRWDELAAKSADPAHLSIDGALRMLTEPQIPAIAAGGAGMTGTLEEDIAAASAALIRATDADWELARLTWDTTERGEASMTEWCRSLHWDEAKGGYYRFMWAQYGHLDASERPSLLDGDDA